MTHAYDPMDDPQALIAIIAHAGTLGEEPDDIAQVRAFHNLDGRLGPYEHGHRLREVFTDTVPAGDEHEVCEDVYALLNIGDDPAFGTPDPRALEYRRRGHRSLSTGDAVAVDDTFYAVDGIGFTRTVQPPVLVTAQQLTPGYTVTETSTGREVAPGDAVYDFRGVRGRFETVSQAPADGKTAKVVVTGHEHHAGVFDLTVHPTEPPAEPAATPAGPRRATETSVSGLTADQHRVIGEYLAAAHPDVVRLSPRSARFLLPPAEAVELVAGVLAGLSGRGYPRQPMASVLRKVRTEHAAAVRRGVA